MSKPFLCEVIQTVDGYVIKREGENQYWGDMEFCSSAYRKTWQWRPSQAFHYTWKWWAIFCAKRIEEKENKLRREQQRRDDFVNKKVWR